MAKIVGSAVRRWVSTLIKPLWVHLDPGVLQTQTVGVGTAARSHQDAVKHQGFGGRFLALETDPDAVLHLLHLDDLRAQHHLVELPSHPAGQDTDQIPVEAGQ